MSKRPVVPESKANLEKFKTEVAKDLGVDMNDDSNSPYMGSIPSKVAGKMGRGGNVGGEMVKRMIAEQERKMANKNNP